MCCTVERLDRESHILLTSPAVTDCARILATMAGVDGNDDVAATIDRSVRGAHDSLSWVE